MSAVKSRGICYELAADAAYEDAMDDPAVRAAEMCRVNAGGRPRVPVAAEPPAALLKHMKGHYTEYQLKNDLDCALSLCVSAKDRAEVRKFAKAKLAGEPYEGPVVLDPKACESCRKPFNPRRSDARFCSAVCRKRGSRRNQGANVTDKPLVTM